MQHTPKSTLYQRLAVKLIQLYPVAWRERYAEEMTLILEDSTPTHSTILNLLLHLCDAHIHRGLVKGRTPQMLKKIRLNELAIYAATFIFFWTWVATAYGNSAYGYDLHAAPSPLIYAVIDAVSYILLLLMIIIGLPILLATLWKALKTRDLLTLLFGLLSTFFPLLVIFTLIPSAIFNRILGLLLSSFEDVLRSINIFGASAYTLTRANLLFFFLGLGISMLFLLLAALRVEPNRRVTHSLLFLTALIPLMMAIGLITLIFRLFPYINAAITFGGGSSFEIWFLVRLALVVLLMIGTFILTLRAFVKALQARRATQVVL